MAGQGTVEEHQLESRVIGRKMALHVIVPPAYTIYRSAPSPVLYFLHPWGLSPTYIIEKLNMPAHLWAGVNESTFAPMVIVLPEGGKSFYLNAADPPGHDWQAVVQQNEEFFRDALTSYGRYGDYLLHDVISFVEATYHVRTDRAGRAIGGISMGGAAAAVHAFRDSSRFGAVGIHSPALFSGPPDNGGPPWIFGLDRASFAQRNPADVAARLVPQTSPRIYLDTGDRDAMLREVEHLHQVLQAKEIEHRFLVRPGGHDKTYWEPHIREYLAFYAQGWRVTDT